MGRMYFNTQSAHSIVRHSQQGIPLALDEVAALVGFVYRVMWKNVYCVVKSPLGKSILEVGAPRR